MTQFLSEADHVRVTEAVTEAERSSNGEIVTIVADSSDRYFDTVLGWALLAMMAAAPLAIMLWPRPDIATLIGGWGGEPDYRWLVALLCTIQIVLFVLILLMTRSLRTRAALTPSWTKIARVRERAIQYFRAAAEKRTTGRTGILIYLSMAEHRAEIVADEAIHDLVDEDVWAEAMAVLVERVKDGDIAGGMVSAVERVGLVLAEHFPKSAGNPNELPDRLIEV